MRPSVFEWQRGDAAAVELGRAKLAQAGFAQDDLRRAVRSWQHAEGLPVTGVLTAAQWDRLMGAETVEEATDDH